MSLRCVCFLLLIFIAKQGLAQEELPSRIWTSSSGTTIKASLIDTKVDAVELRKSNGKTLTVKLSQLSEEDRAFVQSIVNPAPIGQKISGGGRRRDLGVAGSIQAPLSGFAWSISSKGEGKDAVQSVIGAGSNREGVDKKSDTRLLISVRAATPAGQRKSVLRKSFKDLETLYKSRGFQSVKIDKPKLSKYKPKLSKSIPQWNPFSTTITAPDGSKRYEEAVIYFGKRTFFMQATGSDRDQTIKFAKAFNTLIENVPKSEAAATVAAKAAEGPSREWKDATGRFSVTAKLLEQADGKVQLEKADGEVVTLEVKKLSEADQEYLAQIDQDESIRLKHSGLTTLSLLENEIPLVADEWRVLADPAEKTDVTTSKATYPVPSTSKRFFDELVGPYFDKSNQFAAMSVYNSYLDSNYQVATIDLASGEAKNFKVQLGKNDDHYERPLLAISPDGKSVATFEGTKTFKHGRLCFRTIDSPEPPTKTWKIGERGNDFEPVRGWFYSNERLLTFSKRIVMWDTDSAEVVYSIAVPTKSEKAQPAFSPGGKYFSVIQDADVFIIESETGEICGRIESGSKVSEAAFSPDGKRLATISESSNVLRIWDLEQNNLVKDMFYAAPKKHPSLTGDSLLWTNNNFVLVYGEHLIDISLGVTVWQYLQPGDDLQLIGCPTGQVWVRDNTEMVPLKLPHIDMKTMLEGVDVDSLALIKPGDSVAMDLEFPFDDPVNDELTRLMETRLKANEISVVDDAEIKLVARFKEGSEDEISVKRRDNSVSARYNEERERYKERLKALPPVVCTYNPTVVSIDLMKDGKSIWNKNHRYWPGSFLFLKGDETIQEAVDRSCKPRRDFFDTIDFPRYITQMPGGKPLGQSKLTMTGIE